MKDNVKDVLYMLDGCYRTEIGYHPLMFLLKVIVIPVFIFYFVVPDMNAINTTLTGIARFQQNCCGMTIFTAIIAYLVVGYVDIQGMLYAMHTNVSRLNKAFIGLMFAVDVVMVGVLINLMVQLKTVGV